MAYVVGIVIALLVSVMARLVGFDRDRAFYPTVLMVIASYYVLFAVMGGSVQAMLVESLIMMVFFCVAIVGFKVNLWLVAAALAAHGVFDFFHGHIVTNPGVPAWGQRSVWRTTSPPRAFWRGCQCGLEPGPPRAPIRASGPWRRWPRGRAFPSGRGGPIRGRPDG